MNDRNPAKQRKTPYAHLFRISHWILSAGILFMIFSGYGIDSVSMPSWSILHRYPSFYPNLRTIHWHIVVGMLFAPFSVTAFLLFVPKLKTGKLSGLRKITNFLLLGSVLVCTVTSFGLIYSNLPVSVYLASRFLHAVCGMLIAPVCLLIHFFLSLFKHFRLLVPAFAPFRHHRWRQVLWLGIGIAVSWCLFTGTVPYYAHLTELTAVKVSAAAAEPGELHRLPWDTAGSLSVQVSNGVGFHLGTTRALLRALYNPEYLYMKIQWKDPVYNRRYRPWIRAFDGWMHLNPGGGDEVIYNEDKMALLFPINKERDFQFYGCSIYCHNDGASGHGFHWTPHESKVDVWHWKSARTDPLGTVDDKYWFGEGEIKADSSARHGDPGDEGYANNMVEGVDNPIMLPVSLHAEIMGALIQSEAGIYTKAAAEKFPAGSEVPGVIVSESSGDRADIRCRSLFRDGEWTLYLMRKLDTGSPYDVIFTPGGTYDFTMVAFDHNSSRHAYNHRVYRLHFAQ